MQDYKKIYPGLYKDVSRRDFSCNALAWSPDTGIIDFYGGKLDIYAKQIKTVGKPKDRILEDPLRIFRAARFAARYNFTIDPNFIGKARQLADRIFDVSVERWVKELDKLFTAKNAHQGVDILHEMNILQRIVPELYGNSSRTNPFNEYANPYKESDEAWKYLLDHISIPDTIKEPSRTIRYIQSGIISRLKFSNQRRDIILDKSK